jgi:hypothetical protein
LQSQLPVFICFTAAQCNSYFAFCFVTLILEKEYEQRVKFAKIVADEARELMDYNHLRALPSMIILRILYRLRPYSASIMYKS